MTLEYVGAVTLLIGLLSLFRKPPFIIYFFFCATLLGSAAAFVLDDLGGTNISPAHLLLGFLTLRLLTEKNVSAAALQQISFGRPGFWLLVTVICSTIGALCLPRLLAGETFVYAARAQVPFAVPLAPSTSNLTQSIYFIADLICFLMLSACAATSGGMRILGSAALLCAALNLIFGVLDLVTYFTNTAELFAPIRNANYAMLSEAEVDGLKRIVGSFTEASSFASATLVYFAFTGKLWLLGIKPRITFPLAFLSLCAVLFATSTTGYVGLVVLLGYAYLQALPALYRPAPIQTRRFILATPFALSLMVLIIALSPEYSTSILNFLDGTIFNKLSTSSGVERSAWNTQAFQSFLDTFGFGAGNGSVRASSFPIAVLANLGIIGAALFSFFFVSLFLPDTNSRSDVVDDAYRQAARLACLACLITATISGAQVDLGLPFYVFAGFCAATRSPLRAPQPCVLSSGQI